MDDAVRIPIEADTDIVAARQTGRQLAQRQGFSVTDSTLIATAISEIARNITSYARRGEMIISAIIEGERRGIEVTARDEGPGILDVERALQDGYSTGRGMGLGLPGARRLMDEFVVDSKPGRGTTIVMTKWVANRVG